MEAGLLEYELIDIEWELKYDLTQAYITRVVKDESGTNDFCLVDEEQLQFDEDGIPISGAQAEKTRRELILMFLKQWQEEHSDSRIFNKDLNEFITINHKFLREATGHSAKSYLSTKAVFRFEQMVKEATKVAVTKTKEGDKSQQPFQEMIVMKYESENLGTVKLTVGVKFKSHEKVQYGVTVPPGNQPLVDPKLLKRNDGKKREKASHKK